MARRSSLVTICKRHRGAHGKGHCTKTRAANRYCCGDCAGHGATSHVPVMKVESSTGPSF
jgi:hypothetical protein